MAAGRKTARQPVAMVWCVKCRGPVDKSWAKLCTRCWIKSKGGPRKPKSYTRL